ncbi:hypothetical protein AB9P05_05430 [Roseivirga sp. BDSF3-8]|uniref:hypothetical protein n=1 Tax=Roseivirga sp. BDSF3-8 TaxID=3241598 RepID=UPI0035324100
MRYFKIILLAILLVGAIIVMYAYWTSKSQSIQKIDGKALPQNLKIGYWGTDIKYPTIGLVVENDFGFILIGKESKFPISGDTIEVDKINRICFNDKILIAEVNTYEMGEYYIKCIGNNHSDSGKEYRLVAVKNIDASEANNCSWIDASILIKKLE